MNHPSPEYQRRYREQRIAAGICIRCKDPAEPGRQMCARHMEEERAKDRARRPARHCKDCGVEVPSRHTYCGDCAVVHKKAARARGGVNTRRRRDAAGLCQRCGQKPREPDKSLCPACAAANRERANRIYREVRKKEREARIARGVCAKCEAPTTEGRVHCESCLEVLRMTNRKHCSKKRREAK